MESEDVFTLIGVHWSGGGEAMAAQTKGFCKYCGKEYTRSGMLRHLGVCKNRKNELAKETGKRRCRYFQIIISGKYLKDYWLIIETSENTTLKELDKFIREIWVECCGHLSAFTIHGIQYESYPNTDRFWGPPSKNMNYRLKDVVDVGDNIFYEYDFGSITELIVNIHSVREGEKRNSEIVILSRNNPPKIICSNCEQNDAKWVDPQDYYEGVPFWCDQCLREEYGDDENDGYYGPEFLLPICNSPRMGVCGYEGSDIYMDRFVPDEE